MKKILVCGSRTLKDRTWLEAKLEKLTRKLKTFELVTGACPTGADYLAEEWASKQFPAKTIIKKRFHADWANYGKVAGPKRNAQMARYCQPKGVCLAFWNGTSTGTADMIAQARAAGLEVRIFHYRSK